MDELLVAIEAWKKPGVTLPDPLPPEEPYPPSTTIGTLVKASLGRAIGL